MTGVVTKGKILRSDQNLWDGLALSATRVDSTGGTITGNKIGNEVAQESRILTQTRCGTHPVYQGLVFEQ